MYKWIMIHHNTIENLIETPKIHTIQLPLVVKMNKNILTMYRIPIMILAGITIDLIREHMVTKLARGLLLCCYWL
jgi:hypothetical protein